MTDPKTDLVILPFKASIRETGQILTFTQTLTLLNSGQAEFVHLERSYPGAPEAIGWTIFQRTPRAYLYENEPLFETELETRRHIRKAYAIRHEMNGDDALTYSHLHL